MGIRYSRFCILIEAAKHLYGAPVTLSNSIVPSEARVFPANTRRPVKDIPRNKNKNTFFITFNQL